MARGFGPRVGQRIRSQRLAHGWSQAELAEKASLTPHYIGILERGAKLPTLSTLVSLAKVLGVSPADLLAEPRVKDPWLDEVAAVAQSVPGERRRIALAVLKTIARQKL